MFKKLSLVDLTAAVIQLLKKNTDIKTFDFVPENEPSPFAYVEAAGKENCDTKTMFCDLYKVNIHVISEQINGNTSIYKLINQIEEALTEDIILPEGFTLVYQLSQGIESIYEETTKEKHAVMPVNFKVAYDCALLN